MSVSKIMKSILNLALTKKMANGKDLSSNLKLKALFGFIKFIFIIGLVFSTGYFAGKILGLYKIFGISGTYTFIVIFILFEILLYFTTKLIKFIDKYKSIKINI